MNTVGQSKRVLSGLALVLVMAASFLVAGASPAGAQAADCRISDFRNPDGTLDITSYLMCNGMGGIPQPGPECPTADLSLATTVENPSLQPGDTTSITLTGFAPGSEVTVLICGNGVSRVLGTFTAGADGSVNATVTIPSDLPPGDYFLAVTGNRTGGAGQVVYAPISVGTDGGGGGGGTPSGGDLPRTGSDIGQLVGLGLVLALLGAAAAFGSRRFRPAASSAG